MASKSSEKASKLSGEKISPTPGKPVGSGNIESVKNEADQGVDDKTSSSEPPAPPPGLSGDTAGEQPTSAKETEKPQDEKQIPETVDVRVSFQKDGDFSDSESSDTDDDTKACISHYLMLRNTESFKCLAQVLMSNSSLLRQKFYHFPPLEDPGINEAYSYVAPAPVYDNIGVEKYQDLCKDLEIFPSSRVKNDLPTEELNLKYYGMTYKQTKAMTETLKGNAFVRHLNLQDNWFSVEQSRLIQELLEENGIITVLNLQECRMGPEGAECLSQALALSQFLMELNLSYNSLGDAGLLALEKGLSENTSIKILNISHNDLTEDSGEILERILIANKGLEEIDLSWSGFYTGPGNKKLFNGLTQNGRIKWLNLAWNAIGEKPAVNFLVRFIRRSKTLEYIDLSNNCLAGPGFRTVRGAVNRNKSLVTVRIGNNPCEPPDALYMASVLPAKSNDPLRHLDMENIYFNKDVLPVLSRIKAQHKTIVIGGIFSNYTIQGPNINEVLFKRARYLLMKPKKKKAKKDFGHFILRLPDEEITTTDFEAALKKQKIKKLDKDLLNEMCGRFSVKKNRIDCVSMKKAYMGLYPDTELPPEKPKKKKKGKGTKAKGGKKKKGKEAEEEKVLQVHDLAGEGQAGDEGGQEKKEEQTGDKEHKGDGEQKEDKGTEEREKKEVGEDEKEEEKKGETTVNLEDQKKDEDQTNEEEVKDEEKQANEEEQRVVEEKKDEGDETKNDE